MANAIKNFLNYLKLGDDEDDEDDDYSDYEEEENRRAEEEEEQERARSEGERRRRREELREQRNEAKKERPAHRLFGSRKPADSEDEEEPEAPRRSFADRYRENDRRVSAGMTQRTATQNPAPGSFRDRSAQSGSSFRDRTAASGAAARDNRVQPSNNSGTFRDRYRTAEDTGNDRTGSRSEENSYRSTQSSSFRDRARENAGTRTENEIPSSRFRRAPEPEQEQEEERPERSSSFARGRRMERTATNKIVPIRTTQDGTEVCVIKPTAFEDAQDICDMLLKGRACIINLEGIDPAEAQRIIDFVCGTIYAINGKLHAVARYIFIFSPVNVDITGDYAQFFQEEGFGVPKFNKDF